MSTKKSKYTGRTITGEEVSGLKPTELIDAYRDNLSEILMRLGFTEDNSLVKAEEKNQYETNIRLCRAELERRLSAA